MSAIYDNTVKAINDLLCRKNATGVSAVEIAEAIGMSVNRHSENGRWVDVSIAVPETNGQYFTLSEFGEPELTTWTVDKNGMGSWEYENGHTNVIELWWKIKGNKS